MRHHSPALMVIRRSDNVLIVRLLALVSLVRQMNEFAIFQNCDVSLRATGYEENNSVSSKYFC